MSPLRINRGGFFMAKITIGGVEYVGDLDTFIKSQAAFQHINRVRDAYAKVGAPNQDFPEGVPAPDVEGALQAMIDLVAVATFPLGEQVMSQKVFDQKLAEHIDLIRFRLKRSEIDQVRPFFLTILSESDLQEGNGEPPALADQQAQDAADPTASPETSAPSSPS